VRRIFTRIEKPVIAKIPCKVPMVMGISRKKANLVTINRNTPTAVITPPYKNKIRSIYQISVGQSKPSFEAGMFGILKFSDVGDVLSSSLNMDITFKK